MNQEQYLRYAIILAIALTVIVFNHRAGKETPEDVQPSEYIQDKRSLNHDKHLRYL